MFLRTRISLTASGRAFVSIAADKLSSLHSYGWKQHYLWLNTSRGFSLICHLSDFRRIGVPASVWLFIFTFANERMKQMDNHKRKVQTSTTIGHVYLQPSPFYLKTCKVWSPTVDILRYTKLIMVTNDSYSSYCYYN